MGRRWIAVVAVCTTALLIPATRASGGGAVFEFDSDYYVAGDQVTGETSVGFGFGDSAGIADGPYFAWLFRSGTKFSSKDAAFLGPIVFEGGEHNSMNARISFTVPDVRPGLYEIATCNEDCSIRWIGDLVGGSFTVAATREEIPLRQLEDRLTDRIRSLQGRLELFRDRLVETETETNSAASDAQLAVESGKDLESDIRALQAELARLRDQSGSALLELAGWAMAGLLAGASMVLLVVHRRRRQDLVIPSEDAGSDVAEDDRWRPKEEPELVVSGRR